MRFMIIVKSDETAPAPSREQMEPMFAEMGAFNESLVDAGVMLAGDGLLPTAQGARVTVKRGDKATVIDGPFAEAKEVVGGFWIIRAGSLAEAVGWASKVPAMEGYPMELEVRQVVETEDFGDAVSDELKARENELRDRIAAQS